MITIADIEENKSKLLDLLEHTDEKLAELTTFLEELENITDEEWHKVDSYLEELFHSIRKVREEIHYSI